MSAPVVSPSECALPGSPLAAAKHGIDACVHCGFCLQACPTYLTLEDENDSPRGRIVLMRSLLEGTLEPTNQSVDKHIGQCLGCRNCETACPSGVPYGHLLEATRAHAGVAIWPSGEQALANVLRLVDMARRFEASGATSFRAFIEWLEEAGVDPDRIVEAARVNPD